MENPRKCQIPVHAFSILEYIIKEALAVCNSFIYTADDERVVSIHTLESTLTIFDVFRKTLNGSEEGKKPYNSKYCEEVEALYQALKQFDTIYCKSFDTIIKERRNEKDTN